MSIMNNFSSIQRALISVSEKTDIVEFSQFLHQQKVEILSTGGTAELLEKAGVPVTKISEYIDFPEIMAGRVKTLHPKIHGGLLGRESQDDDDMQTHEIKKIDLLIVNLYPFEETVAGIGDDGKKKREEIIENIDIGGPAMIRSAAKNHNRVVTIVSPDDYQSVQQEMEANNNSISYQTRVRLAAKAYAKTANYDAMIAEWFSNDSGSLPPLSMKKWKENTKLRYGENPYQDAMFYHNAATGEVLPGMKQLQGKQLSYNNIMDIDAAAHCVNEFSIPACVIIKHANPCGVACADNIETAYKRAYAADQISAFGGIIAINRPLSKVLASNIIQRQFVEVIVAPELEKAALEVLQAKQGIRVLVGSMTNHDLHYRSAAGGILVQKTDLISITEDQLICKTQRLPTENELRDLLFAFRVVKHVKSNAIVIASAQTSMGIGAGQTNRVASIRIASQALGADSNCEDLVLASDGFFPFRDNIDTACEAGVRAIIQPGGSIHDDEVIAAADEKEMTMVFTNNRCFRH